jgi:hypothetical protein
MLKKVNLSFNLLKLILVWITSIESGLRQNFKNKTVVEVELLLALKEVELVEVVPFLSLQGKLHDKCQATKLT